MQQSGVWRNKLAHSHGVREVVGAGPITPTMKAIPKDIQEEARRLRKLGKSHREIAKILHIGVGTVHNYSRDIRISEKRHVFLLRRSYLKGLARLSKEQRYTASVKGGINTPYHFRLKYSKENLIQLLVKFQENNGRIPTKRDFMNMYGSFFRTFGTWNKAIQTAGFSPNPVLFAKKYISKDGHKCDSLAEKIIDDWLFTRKIFHERSVPYKGTRYTADFKIGNTLIEFFGLHNQLKRYDALMKEKFNLVQKYKLNLISIYPEDIFPISRLTNILGKFSTNL